ncbi:permeases of the drug/metabolite transporter (DMT) superfamily [Acetobacter aceti NRIC 0242]|nr:EamA domain-containing membrane protein RarD [Acetobacter aceti NBRC 14818]GBO81816.1 permeases of the drug/metabolite transporter (DMT) superfamily [Acetobacter aceti NRIC 0242]
MQRQRQYGLILVTVATLFWSLAGLFVHLIDVPVGDLILWRSFFAGCALLAIAVLCPARESVFGWAGFGASLLSAASMGAYAASLTLTSVANVMILYATLPFFTAAIGWAFIGERSPRRALVASVVSLIGVGIVAGQGMQLADMAGNLLALLMTVTFAGLLILARAIPRLNLALINAVAAFLCSLVALPFSSGSVPGLHDLTFLFALGILTTALSFLLFLMGSRFISSTEAALVELLDVVLGPLWVWLVLSEYPGTGALIGGGIVLAAVLWNLAPSLRYRYAKTSAATGQYSSDQLADAVCCQQPSPVAPEGLN